MTKDQLYKEIRYKEVVQPAIAEFHKTIARKKRVVDRVETLCGANWRKTIDPVDMSFLVKEFEHFLASFGRLSEKTIVAYVVKIVKDTIDNRINHTRRRVRATPFIIILNL